MIARVRGRCPACRQPIWPGKEIVKSKLGAYEHASCPVPAKHAKFRTEKRGNVEWVYRIAKSGTETLFTKRTLSDHVGDLDKPIRDTPRPNWRADIIPDAMIDAPYPRVNLADTIDWTTWTSNYSKDDT